MRSAGGPQQFADEKGQSKHLRQITTEPARTQQPRGRAALLTTLQ